MQKNKVWNKVICSILTNFAAEMYFSSEEKYQVFSKIHGELILLVPYLPFRRPLLTTV